MFYNMNYILVGLGNPGAEYENTRHNTGKMFLEYLAVKNKTQLTKSKSGKAEDAEIKLGKKKALLVFPTVFMNNSGKVISSYVKSAKDRERLAVVYDDLDLPLGKVKLSYGRNSGGHRGLESIIKNLKSKDFLRVRIGISPASPSGKLRKPSGEKEVIDFILAKFKPSEKDVLKKEFKRIGEALEVFVEKGREVAMSTF